MRTGIASLLVAVACAFAAPAALAESWAPVDGTIHPSGELTGLDMAVVGGVPYVTWSAIEGPNRNVRLARLEGGHWVAVGGVLNRVAGRDAENPKIVDAAGTPYLTWREADANGSYVVEVARVDSGGAVTPVGTPIDRYPSQEQGDNRFYAAQPDIAYLNGHVYVSFLEDNGVEFEVWLARDNGEGGWEYVHAPDTIPTAASIATSGGHVYVGHTGGGQTFVSRLNDTGDGFDLAGGGPVSGESTGGAPHLADVNGTLYVAYNDSGSDQSQLIVRRLNGDAWETVGDPVTSQQSPSAGVGIVGAGSTPYVSWNGPAVDNPETSLFVSRPATAGPAWDEAGGGAVTTKNDSRQDDALAADGATPYVAFLSGDINVYRLKPTAPPIEPPAPGPACGKVVSGTSGPDVLVGDAHRNTLLGLGGSDRIFGLEQADCIDGGLGNDYIEGAGGADALYGGSGKDMIRGGADEDLIEGGPGNDKLYGGPDEDEIHGGSGNDYIKGGDGYDRIFGGKGNDRIDATGKGLDTVDCGPGKDRVKAYRHTRLLRCEKVKLVR